MNKQRKRIRSRVHKKR